MSDKCLPVFLKRARHDDWPWPLRYIPRAWTSFCGNPPDKLLGNQFETAVDWKGKVVLYPKPIPPPGQWQISWPPYVAVTLKNRWHFRAGVRWDDTDFYFTFPSFKIGRLPQ